MKQELSSQTHLASRLAVIALATVVAIPAFGQQAPPSSTTPQSTPPTAMAAQPASGAAAANNEKEGFWGRVNPFARKVWVKKRIDPINDRLNELDAVNAKNAKDIQDVDSRAQAGIKQAQAAADAANQTATAAGTQAQQANSTAQTATGHVTQLNTTVNGLDQYHQVTEAEITFKGGLPRLSDEAKKQLDDLATTVTGQKGYILEVEGHAPGAGSVGIQSSERLTEAVKRYLVTEHDIPVYRLHAVALGNAVAADPAAPQDPGAKPVRVKTSTVHIRLMENSLAAQ